MVKDNSLSWELTTKTAVIEPRTRIDVGNVKIVSNADVDAIENADTYNVSNSRIRVIFNKYPKTPPGTINIDDIIEKIHAIDEQGAEQLVGSPFTFSA